MNVLVRLFALAALLALTGASLAADEKGSPRDKLKGKGGAATLEKMFDKIDADGDGKITKEEFVKFLEERAKEKGRGDRIGMFAGRIFDRLDGNKDGKLTKEEFAKFRDVIGKLRGGAGGAGGKGGALRDRLKERLKEKKGDE